MKQRFITSIFIVLAVVLATLSKLLPYQIGDYIFDIFVLVLIIIAGIEIGNIMEKNNKNLNKVMATFYAVFNYIILLICLKSVEFKYILLIQFAGLVLYWLIALIIEVLTSKTTPFKQQLVTSLNTLLACIYPSFLFCLLLVFNHVDVYAGVEYFSLVFVIMVFAITWLTDTFAYLVGCTLKGPKLAPKISPNKTISGAVGGLLGGVGGAMLVFLLICQVPALTTIFSMYSFKWWHFLIIGLFGSMFGQMGDLFESKLKRSAGVKDSGNLFPGHGGMLDRVDAMIFISTFVYLVIFFILL